MYAALHETDESTAVNLSCYGRFIPGSGYQLLTLGQKYLRLFRSNPYALTIDEEDEEWTQKTRLECVFSTRLLCPVQDVAYARIPLFPSADAILLAFDDAKLSIVGVSPTERALQTISLHSFEDETMRDGYSNNFYAPIVRADPDSRCAAMLVYGRHMAVLPFTESSQHIHSYTVRLSNIDVRLENVLDMTFLHGYYEPTILFLYEPLQTTAGRSTIRSDTCAIMGVSLNTHDRQHAVVWQMSQLPMDCYRMQPIPQPIGGAVVFGADEVIYLNQSVPPCGVAVNSCLDSFTKFPLKDMRNLSIVLDGSESAVVAPGRILVGSREGILFLFSLLTDSTNSVKGMDVTQLTEISTPCTMCSCVSGHVFIGSRLGDSQLLQYEIQQVEDEINGEPSIKKSHIEDMDEDDKLLYGDEDEEGDKGENAVPTKELWIIRQLDRLLNVGPIMSMTAGAANQLAEVYDGNKTDPIFDIVTASGRQRDGALCIMQRTLRPLVLSSTPIEGARELWSVGVKEDGTHRYLVVARERSTIVLELQEEMVELENPIFILDELTVAAGELADGAIVVQVTTMSICLVSGEKQLECFPVDSNFPVVAASISDPFVALLTENGRLIIYRLELTGGVHLKELDLSTTPLSSSAGVTITAMSLYKDMSGLLFRESTVGGSRKKREGKMSRAKKTIDEDQRKEEEDLDDLLLYGDSRRAEKKKEEELSASIMARKRKRVIAAASATGGEESDVTNPNEISPSHWIVVAKNDGKVAIFELPTMSLAFQVCRFHTLPDVLVDATGADEDKERKDATTVSGAAGDAVEGEIHQKPEEKVVEITLFGMGINQSRPVLLAVVDDLVVAYEVFIADNENEGHLAIRFHRLPFTLAVRTKPFMGTDGMRAPVETVAEERKTRTILHTFERIGSVMHGVLIAGPHPCLAMMSAWGGFRAHPITLDSRILSFTAFNNENLNAGFLYLAEEESTMRVARFNPNFNYELSMPTRKVPIEKTVHFVRYCLQSQVYAVVTSRSSRSNRLCSLINDEKQIDSHERPDSFVCPSVEEYAVDLYSADDWMAVPNTGITLQEMEVATTCEEVLLRSESTISGFQNYVAVGTINNYGEEVLIRGRIILIEVIEVVPEPGQPTSKHKMKVLYDKEQKGPVTSLCACNGFLLSGMGQKIFIWQYKDNDLQGVSFLDMHYYVHSVCSEQFKALSICSRDDRPSANPPLSCSFLVDNDKLGFLLTDDESNVIFFNYLPRDGQATGDSLSLRGAVNVGTRINAFLRVKGHTSTLPSMLPLERAELCSQQSTVWASLDGSVGWVRSVSEKLFRRLHCLQQSMASLVPQACGLNPRGARALRPQRPSLVGESNRNMVDVDSISQFLHLSVADKQELARKLGGNRYQMMDDMIMLDRLATFF